MEIAWAYARYSSEMQDDNTLEAQIHTIKEVAAANGDQIPDEYQFKDSGYSGRSATDRPSFMEMIFKLTNAKIRPKRVYVYKYSRYMRDQFEAQLYKQKLRALGVDLISATEPLPDDILTANLMENLIHSINEYQSGITGAQSLAGTKQIVRNGYWSGGPAPFGYRLIKVENAEGHRRDGEIVMRARLMIDELEAPIVRRIYELAAATGYGGARIYVLLCAERGGPVLGRKGKPLGARGVNYILRNPIYKGSIIYNDSGYRKVIGSAEGI